MESFIRGLAAQGWLRVFGNSTVSLGLCAMLFLSGCMEHGNAVDMVSASVEPAVVATPSASSPSPFVLKFRAGGEGADVMIKLHRDANEDLHSGTNLIYSIFCGGDKCLSQDVEVSCTSSLNSANASLRDIKCENMPENFETVAPGSYAVRFMASSSDARMFVEAETDTLWVPIEIK